MVCGSKLIERKDWNEFIKLPYYNIKLASITYHTITQSMYKVTLFTLLLSYPTTVLSYLA